MSSLRLHGVGRQRLDIGADAPAHDKLPASVAIEILIVHAVHDGAAALHGAEQTVAVVLIQPVHHDLQGLFVGAAAQEHQRLLPSIVLQIHHLHGLDVPSAGGGCVLVALRDQTVQLLGKAGVLRRHAGQGEQLLHGGVEHGAAGQSGGQCQPRQQQDALFHGALHGGSPLSVNIQCTLYHSPRRFGSAFCGFLAAHHLKKESPAPGLSFYCRIMRCPPDSGPHRRRWPMRGTGSGSRRCRRR